jgi:hypothetical protein
MLVLKTKKMVHKTRVSLMQRQAGKTGANDKRLQAIKVLIAKAEVDYLKLCDDYYKQHNEFMYVQRGIDQETVNKFKELELRIIAILDLTKNICSQAQIMTNEMRSRVFRIEIKATALLLRHDLSLHAAMAPWRIRKDRKTVMFSVVNQFIKHAAWFKCGDDAACQRDLYFLYELRSAFPADDFDGRLFLKEMISKCDSGLTRLMAMQSHMIEAIQFVERMGTKKTRGDFDAIVEHRREFVSTYKTFIRNPDFLGNIGLAKAHFVAYRYELMYFYYHLCGRNKLPFFIRVARKKDGECESVMLLPQFNNRITSPTLKEFLEHEKKLRETYYQPALALLEALDYGLLPEEVRMQTLINSFLEEGMEHSERYGEHTKALLAMEARKEITLTPACIELLLQHCQELAKLHAAWVDVFHRNKEENISKIFEKLPEAPQKDMLGELLESDSKRVEERSDALTVGIDREVQRQTIAKKEREDKRIEAVEELKLLADDEHNKIEASRRKKRETLAAQHEVWVEAQRLRSEREKAAREAKKKCQPATSDAPAEEVEVKSEYLIALEEHDGKTSELGTSLFSDVEYIEAVLSDKLASDDLLDDEVLAEFDERLKNSLTEFEELLQQHQRYQTLLASVPDAEKQKYARGIKMSLQHVEVLEIHIRGLLCSSSELLVSVVKKSAQDKEDFIKFLGQEEAAKVGEDDATPKRIFDLGWEKFKQLGKGKKTASPVTLERQFFSACLAEYYPRLQALRRPQITTPGRTGVFVQVVGGERKVEPGTEIRPTM